MSFSIGLLILLSVLGGLGFYFIEGLSPLNAMYMTVITMSTVGYGTIKELTSGGKVFATILIIFSAGTFLYAISTITTFVLEGEINKILFKFRLNNKVSKLKNHIIICGLGRNGQEVAKELTKQKKDFVIIEKDEDIINEFVEHHPGALAILGDATEENTLEDAQISQAFGLISSAATDADNVYITLTAREMNPNLRIVSRALQESTVPKLKRAGATEVLLPYQIGGSKMANLITRPALVEFIGLVSGENAHSFHLEIMPCYDHDDLIGNSIKQLDIRNKTGATIIALKKGSESIELAPSGNRVLHKDDRMFVLGNEDQLTVFKETYLKQ